MRDGGVRLQILGPLRAWRDGAELDVGPRQQACLLAVLLARCGHPISMDKLIELIWDDASPASAVNVVHKYVGALRRLLEPSVRAREAGSYLRRRGNGYLFEGQVEELDVVAFRRAIQAAKAELAQGRDDTALDCYVEALGRWHGPAAEGLNAGPAALALFAAVDDEFFDACTAAAELAVPLGQPERVLQPLQLAASMAHLHEPVHASLIAALSAGGKNAQALLAFHALRQRLADELGVYPGAAAQAAYQQALTQTSSTVDQEPSVQEDSRVAVLADHAPARPAPAAGPPLIGRGDEVTRACQAVEAASAGSTGLVIIEGDPGVGKTRLLEEVTAIGARMGVRTAWGRCLEGGDAPAMWPWVEVLGGLVDALPSPARDEWAASELGRILRPREEVLTPVMAPDGGAPYRLFERVLALVRQVCAVAPVALVFDDLQWADVASLELLGYLAARLPAGAAVVGALRARAPEPGPDLARMLAAVSRVPAHRRVSLGPLAVAEVAELVRRETGLVPGPGAARGMHARTAGNPFFVRELSRLLAEGGALTAEAVAAVGVPSTVRDVVRDRVSGVDDSAADLLTLAAFIGRDVDLRLLARTAAIDVDACLARLGPVVGLGLLEPTRGNPFSLRFAHDLVREVVAEATLAPRSARIHLRVADALDDVGPDDESTAERRAYHLWAAGPLADPARTTNALLLASRRATTKFALAAAERQCQLAADVARAAGLPDLELAALTQLTAVVAMATGFVALAPVLLERAEHLAHRLGRELEAADFLFARWTALAYSTELDRSGSLARRLLEQSESSEDPVIRSYGLHAWGVHQWALGNIGESIRYLGQLSPATLRPLGRPGDNGLRRDQQLLSPVKLAEVMALIGDLDAARELLAAVENAAADHPYAIATWATWASKIAAMAGDPAWALRAAQRGIDADPERTFAFFDGYTRLNLCWARAMSGDDAAGPVAEARDLVAGLPLNPPRAGITSCYEFLAEMFLAAGMLADAATTLDQAQALRESRGERQTEGLSLLLRARLLEARGDHAAAVTMAERARSLSAERGANLFARRAEKLLRELAQN
jgi:DNA-binding SARP family transcriptional activator/tetratricopeptide (TPR) repeat protein